MVQWAWQASHGAALVLTMHNDRVAAPELAPPATVDCQPVWLEARPTLASDPTPAWPFGYSALRLDVMTAAAGAGAAAPVAPGDPFRLWWQAAPHPVIFAIPRADDEARQLPLAFRARA